MKQKVYWFFFSNWRVNAGSAVKAGYTMEPLWYDARKHQSLDKKSQEKNSIHVLIHLISHGLKLWLLYIFFFYVYSYNSAKSPILCKIIFILAVRNSLKWHICEFSQFGPALIAPINFGSRRTRPWSPWFSAAPHIWALQSAICFLIFCHPDLSLFDPALLFWGALSYSLYALVPSLSLACHSMP